MGVDLRFDPRREQKRPTTKIPKIYKNAKNFNQKKKNNIINRIKNSTYMLEYLHEWTILACHTFIPAPLGSCDSISVVGIVVGSIMVK